MTDYSQSAPVDISFPEATCSDGGHSSTDEGFAQDQPTHAGIDDDEFECSNVRSVSAIFHTFY